MPVTVSFTVGGRREVLNAVWVLLDAGSEIEEIRIERIGYRREIPSDHPVVQMLMKRGDLRRE